MKGLWCAVLLLSAAAELRAQDQQVGARTKAMGGSYTAFEDDPISLWLNPAGISTQPDGLAIAYQTSPVYEPRFVKNREFASPAETGWNDPAIIPSFLGMVFQLGDSENPHSVGICFATPFRMKYFYDNTFNTFLSAAYEQTFYRFRAAYAHDFRLRESGSEGWFTHLSVGGGLDLSVTKWRLEQFAADPSLSPPPPQSLTFNDLGYGFGVGLLLGVYEGSSFRLNLGFAYQSSVSYEFSVDPIFVPVFKWPHQVNGGITFYLFDGYPLRITLDAQFIGWDRASANSELPGGNNFQDVYNYSLGAEYRFKVGDRTNLFPRAGLRFYDAPWQDVDQLPSVGFTTLAIEARKERFLIYSIGLGLSWSTEEGRTRTIDIAYDNGGEAPGFALSFTMEF